jgi:hypothetical protein
MLFESLWMTRRYAALNVARDEMMAPAWRLREIAHASSGADARATLVFCPDPAVCDMLPSTAPQPVLWAWHMPSFAGATMTENKERLYTQLYYAGVDETEFARLMRSYYSYRGALFGWGRVISGLSADLKPVTAEDERAEIESYARFVAGFDRARAASRQLSYVVVLPGDESKLANLDRWYERDAGERTGLYTLYRLRLRR